VVRRAPRLIGLAAGLALAACSSGGGRTTASPSAPGSGASAAGASSVVATSTPPTTAATTIAETTTTSTTTPSTTLPTTTTTTVAPDSAALATDALQRIELGRSVEGRPIVAVERGAPGGLVVLVIGVIHGDEAAGVEVVRRLATAPLPPGVDLWLVESINPDGQANGTRSNANQVDLNRNFPRRWAPLGLPGDWQYAGPAAASEPETQAIIGLIERIRPDLGLWYHQDLFRIAPGTGQAGEVRRRYAELTGLPLVPITGGTYTGTAAAWQREAISEGVSFIIELGPLLSPAEADTHTAAVLTIAADLAS
jgi:protein MpaA